MTWDDKIRHALLFWGVEVLAGLVYVNWLGEWGLAVSVLNSASLGVCVEATQFEGWWRKKDFSWAAFKKYWWTDTALDLVADAVGIALGVGTVFLIAVLKIS